MIFLSWTCPCGKPNQAKSTFPSGHCPPQPGQLFTFCPLPSPLPQQSAKIKSGRRVKKLKWTTLHGTIWNPTDLENDISHHLWHAFAESYSWIGSSIHISFTLKGQKRGINKKPFWRRLAISWRSFLQTCAGATQFCFCLYHLRWRKWLEIIWSISRKFSTGSVQIFLAGNIAVVLF